MKLIPVLDIKNSQVVTAKRGNRQAYTASDTPLCRSSHPQAVLSALLALHPFDTLYIADLDAISGEGSNMTLIHALHLAYPSIEFWVDNGLTQLDLLCDFARPVIGTESLTSCTRLQHLTDMHSSPILSLDYHADQFIGPAGLDQQPTLWPVEVILMTLSRVGSASGPDTVHLQQLIKQAPGKKYYAAGGVRNHSDLKQLQTMGAAGVLLSTALHQGGITPAELQYFSSLQVTISTPPPGL